MSYPTLQDLDNINFDQLDTNDIASTKKLLSDLKKSNKELQTKIKSISKDVEKNTQTHQQLNSKNDFILKVLSSLNCNEEKKQLLFSLTEEERTLAKQSKVRKFSKILLLMVCIATIVIHISISGLKINTQNTENNATIEQKQAELDLITYY